MRFHAQVQVKRKWRGELQQGNQCGETSAGHISKPISFQNSLDIGENLLSEGVPLRRSSRPNYTSKNRESVLLEQAPESSESKRRVQIRQPKKAATQNKHKRRRGRSRTHDGDYDRAYGLDRSFQPSFLECPKQPGPPPVRPAMLKNDTGYFCRQSLLGKEGEREYHVVYFPDGSRSCIAQPKDQISMFEIKAGRPKKIPGALIREDID